MMRLFVAVLNLGLGSVYTSYGIMTLADLRRGWASRAELHFGLAWLAMAFTCGPHHLEHGLHMVVNGPTGGALDATAVLVGLPFGATWFLLRVEAFRGGRGDRFVSGTPVWLRALPWALGVYGLAVVGVAISMAARSQLHPVLAPNVWLLALYMLIGFYLLRTQLDEHAASGGWSVSGVSLTVVFPTCAMMHIVWLLYAAAGVYTTHWHLLLIDWLAVPAALYFVWVVRELQRGVLWGPAQPAVTGAEVERVGV